LRDKKKNLQPKRKNLFALRFFYLSRGKRSRRRRETKRGRTKRRAIHPPVNSNLPVEALPERERVLLFINRGKSPLFYKYKKQYQRKKQRKEHNFRKNPQKEKLF